MMENLEKNPLILCSNKRETFQSKAHSMYKMTNTSTATLYQHLILILKICMILFVSYQMSLYKSIIN